jgi:O2-independent ubiquinone biosynthesis accessory factor UbiT
MSRKPYAFPRQLGRLIERLPTWPSSFTFTCILDLALRQVIRRGDLQALYGKRVAIQVTDMGLHLYFTVKSSGFSASTGNMASDLTISASAYDFYLLAMRKEDPDTLFFNRRLVVEGDTELGLVAKNTLDSIEYSIPKIEQLFPKHLLARLKASFLA